MKGLNVISLGSHFKTHFNIANLFLLKILSASISFMKNKFIFHFWGLNPYLIHAGQEPSTYPKLNPLILFTIVLLVDGRKLSGAGD